MKQIFRAPVWGSEHKSAGLCLEGGEGVRKGSPGEAPFKLHLEGKAGVGQAEKRKCSPDSGNIRRKAKGWERAWQLFGKTSEPVMPGTGVKATREATPLGLRLGSALQGLCGQAEEAGHDASDCHIKKEAGFRQRELCCKGLL